MKTVSFDLENLIWINNFKEGFLFLFVVGLVFLNRLTRMAHQKAVKSAVIGKLQPFKPTDLKEGLGRATSCLNSEFFEAREF